MIGPPKDLDSELPVGDIFAPIEDDDAWVEDADLEHLFDDGEGDDLAQDGDRWITIHPNGPDAKGMPMKIDDATGEVKAGAGGKFNGQKIGELGKGKSESSPSQEHKNYSEQRALEAYRDKPHLRAAIIENMQKEFGTPSEFFTDKHGAPPPPITGETLRSKYFRFEPTGQANHYRVYDPRDREIDSNMEIKNRTPQEFVENIKKQEDAYSSEIEKAANAEEHERERLLLFRLFIQEQERAVENSNKWVERNGEKVLRHSMRDVLRDNPGYEYKDSYGAFTPSIFDKEARKHNVPVSNVKIMAIHDGPEHSEHGMSENDDEWGVFIKPDTTGEGYRRDDAPMMPNQAASNDVNKSKKTDFGGNILAPKQLVSYVGKDGSRRGDHHTIDMVLSIDDDGGAVLGDEEYNIKYDGMKFDAAELHRYDKRKGHFVGAKQA